MDLLGKLIMCLRKAFPTGDFYYDPIFKKGCATHIIWSKQLNQLIIVKFPNREHYISKALAHQYLEKSRLNLQKKFGLEVYQKTYILPGQ